MATPKLTASVTHLVVMVAVSAEDTMYWEYMAETYSVDPSRMDFTDVVCQRLGVKASSVTTDAMRFSSVRNRYASSLDQDTTVAWRSVESLTDTRRLTQPDLGGQRAAEARLVQELTGGVADLEGLPARSVPCIGLVNLTYTKGDR